PKPTRSNSTPFTTLNTAITARPVWCVRAVINSRDYHTLRRLNRSVTCGAVTNGLRPYILLQGLILKPCAWSELTVSCRHAESFRPILLMSDESKSTVEGHKRLTSSFLFKTSSLAAQAAASAESPL